MGQNDLGYLYARKGPTLLKGIQENPVLTKVNSRVFIFQGYYNKLLQTWCGLKLQKFVLEARSLKLSKEKAEGRLRDPEATLAAG